MVGPVEKTPDQPELHAGLAGQKPVASFDLDVSMAGESAKGRFYVFRIFGPG